MDNNVEFKFLHSDDPDSLVMLINREVVLHKLLKQKITPIFIWIYTSESNETRHQIRQICTELKIDFNFCHSVIDFHKLFAKDSDVSPFYVIT